MNRTNIKGIRNKGELCEYQKLVIYYMYNNFYNKHYVFQKTREKMENCFDWNGQRGGGLDSLAFPFGDEWDYAGNQLFYDSGFNGAGHSGRYSDDY